MFAIRLTALPTAVTRMLPVRSDGSPAVGDPVLWPEVQQWCRTADSPGAAGAVQLLPRPGRTPARVLVVGVGDGSEGDWRTAGAAAVRAVRPDEPFEVLLPPDAGADPVRGVAEGIWLAAYRFEGAPGPVRSAGVDLVTAGPDRHAAALAAARTTAWAVRFARDLTNTPSSVKNPPWLAGRIVAEAANRPDVTVHVRDERQLAAEGFGALLAVGGGSATPPRLVELGWHPPGARTHVVLVGKGITFDTGGLSIKTREGMKLMKKDMGGAAAVLAATLAAADLRLPVRITTLAPLAENAVSGSAYRPGDVLRHYDGTTTETTNSDAEGRLVLADALGYAVRTLAPDVVVDLATLTGANAVALGKRTAALYTHSAELAAGLTAAATAAGEHVWRLPLPDDYLDLLRSDIADRHSSPAGGPGSVVAALFLREFLGDVMADWAHLDMSAPSWSADDSAELTKGATGWGVRTLLRWLTTIAA